MSWQAIQTNGAAPDARHGHAAAGIEGKLYVFGGNIYGAGFNDTHMFDPATSTWSAVACEGAPTPRWGITGVALGSRLFVFGGLSVAGYMCEMQVLDTTTGVWTNLPIEGTPCVQGIALASASRNRRQASRLTRQCW